MKINTKIDAENNRFQFVISSIVRSMSRLFCPKVYADEDKKKDDTDKTENDDTTSQSLNYEDLIAQARKEEKDKLYKTINDLKEKIKVLTDSNNNYLLSTASQDKKIKELNEQLTKAGKDDPEEVSGLKKKLKDALDLVNTLQDKVDNHKDVDEETLRAQIEAEVKSEYEVKMYRLQKLQEAGDKVLIPELVMGNTKEDIDTSIAVAITRSDELRAKLGIKPDDNKDNDNKNKRKPNNPNNPPNKGGKKQYDSDYIAGLDPESEEYKEWRKAMGFGSK